MEGGSKASSVESLSGISGSSFFFECSCRRSLVIVVGCI